MSGSLSDIFAANYFVIIIFSVFETLKKKNVFIKSTESVKEKLLSNLEIGIPPHGFISTRSLKITESFGMAFSF